MLCSFTSTSFHSTVIYKPYIQDQDIQSNFKGVFYLTDSLYIVIVVLYRHHFNLYNVMLIYFFDLTRQCRYSLTILILFSVNGFRVVARGSQKYTTKSQNCITCEKSKITWCRYKTTMYEVGLLLRTYCDCEI
jgi:hypothetical protein